MAFYFFLQFGIFKIFVRIDFVSWFCTFLRTKVNFAVRTCPMFKSSWNTVLIDCQEHKAHSPFAYKQQVLLVKSRAISG